MFGYMNTTDEGSTKMTLCTVPAAPRSQLRERRPGRPPSGKRLTLVRTMPGKVRSTTRRSLDPCDNSNDSGLGFDHHSDPHHTGAINERLTWTGERAEPKRARLDIKLESDEINDGYNFPDAIRSCKDSTSLIRTAPISSVPVLNISSNQSSSQGRAVPRCIPLINRHSPSSAPVTLTTQLSTSSRYFDIALDIVKQPEQQHRARYQTEGSRGAVKDREGNGFPIVQLSGYHKPATLQVFIGTDVGKVSPHMFYQACRVSGKNSTPCTEKKIDGTIVIELQLDPSKDMLATCDCVGILKERNVDVEHRFPDQLGSRSKKKSTRCRMIFRTTIVHDNGVQETLQVCSQPIVCTQPPGIPEICKKSLTACPATGGLELFVLGKNFLKDTRVYFQQVDDDRHVRWEQSVVPDKEFLQQTHFVCVVPPFLRPDITEPVTVRLYVVSSGKMSEPHQFVYTPVNGAVPSVHAEPPPSAPFLSKMLWTSVNKQEQDLGMMPPPGTSLVPLSSRRSSTSIATANEAHSPPVRALKQELLDENSQSSILDPMELRQERYRHLSESSLDVHQGDSNMSMINDNSIDMLHHNAMGMDLITSNMNENSNLSMNNDNTMDMVGCNSSVRPVTSIYESPLNVGMGGSNLTPMNNDSNCSALHTAGLLKSVVPTHIEMPASMEDYKGIDLRMKMPMATVSDLVSTNAPSLSTLQKFGVTEASTILPNQSAQSIENYLTTLESTSKVVNALSSNIQSVADIAMKEKLVQMISSSEAAFTHKMLNSLNQRTHLGALRECEPVYMTSQQQHLSDNQNEAINIVAKSEAAAVADQSLPEQTNITSAMTRSPNSSIPINTERLDALVNSTVEKHICSPTGPNNSPSKRISPTQPPEIMITTDDVMLNSQASIMVSPGMSTTISSPTLNQLDGSSHHHASPNISSDVILNSQISPSLMCRNANTLSQDTLLPANSLNNMEPSLISSQITIPQPSSMASLLVPTNPKIHPSILSITENSEAENAILLKATVDLYETKQKLSELDHNLSNTKGFEKVQFGGDLMPDQSQRQLVNSGNSFVQPQFSKASSSPNSKIEDGKADYPIIPVPVKEMANGTTPGDKKNEDRMIPPVFATMSENELISIINPSCFDQV